MDAPQPIRPDDYPFRERVYAAVRAVPRGRVVSYGAIAAIIGAPRAARAVGHALRQLGAAAATHAHHETHRHDQTVPWWRVLNRAGAIAIRGSFHDAAVQRALLEAEGVDFDHAGRVDWNRHGWDGDALDGSARS